MSADVVNDGSTDDDGTGDTIRASFTAINLMLQKTDATSAAALILLEDTTGGTNKHTITSGTTAISSDRTIALADNNVTLDQDVASGSDVTWGDVTIGTTSVFHKEDAALGAIIRLAEDSDLGTDYVQLQVPSGGLGANRTVEFGDNDLTFDQDLAIGSAVSFGDVTAGTTTTFRAETGAVTGAIVLAELTGGGTNTVTMAAPSAVTSNRTITVPDANVDLTDVNTLGDATADNTLQAKRVARVVWDHGGGLTTAASPFALSVTLPDNAIVTRAWYQVVTTFTSSGDLAVIGLGITTNDADGIVGAAAIGAGGDIWDAGNFEGIQDGTVANYSTQTTAARTFEGTITTENTTAGKLILFAEYVVAG